MLVAETFCSTQVAPRNLHTVLTDRKALWKQVFNDDVNSLFLALLAPFVHLENNVLKTKPVYMRKHMIFLKRMKTCMQFSLFVKNNRYIVSGFTKNVQMVDNIVSDSSMAVQVIVVLKVLVGLILTIPLRTKLLVVSMTWEHGINLLLRLSSWM